MNYLSILLRNEIGAKKSLELEGFGTFQQLHIHRTISIFVEIHNNNGNTFKLCFDYEPYIKNILMITLSNINEVRVF